MSLQQSYSLCLWKNNTEVRFGMTHSPGLIEKQHCHYCDCKLTDTWHEKFVY